MFDTLFLTILRDMVLFSVIIISWLHWRRQISKREDLIEDLQTDIKGKHVDLNDSEKRLQEQQTELESLSTQLSQREEAINGLYTQIKERDSSINLFKETVADLEKQNQETTTHAEDAESRVKDLNKRTQEQDTQIKNFITKLSQREGTIRGLTAQNKEKDNSINLLKVQAADLEKQNQDTTTRAEDAEAREEDLKKLTQEKETRIESLNTELSQREEIIRGLNVQIEKRDSSINLFKETVADLEKQHQDTTTRAEHAEASVRELENSIDAKEKEIAALTARSRARQDNFAYIAGIGLKVSAILRSAGINTFAQLAATDVKRMRKILEAENPNLLRLIDPSSWSEQAKMAAEGDWEALSELQESLKESRRS